MEGGEMGGLKDEQACILSLSFSAHHIVGQLIPS